MRSTPFRWRTKPPLGSRLDPDHPFSQFLGGFWLFNEGSGPTCFDLTGNGNHGTLGTSPAPAWQPARTGQGLYFTGSNVNGSVHVASPTASIMPTTGLSFGCWFRPVTWSGGNGYPDLMSLDDVNDTIGYGIYISPLTTGQLFYAVGTANVDNVATSATAGAWSHAMVTWSGAAGATLYVNAINCHNFAFAGPISYTGNTGLGLGNIPSTAASENSNFVLDCAWVYGRCLSAAEVAAHYENTFAAVLAPAHRRYFKFGGATIFSRSAAGGLIIGGSAAPSVIFTPGTAGGVIAGGSVTPSATFTPSSPSGGAIVGGTAQGSPIFKPSAAGGAIVGGSASPSATFTESPQGGAIVGGQAVPTPVFAPVIAGGVIVGGTASPGNTYTATASGGVVLGGASVPSASWTVSAAGGVEIGGTASGSIAGNAINAEWPRFTWRTRPPLGSRLKSGRNTPSIGRWLFNEGSGPWASDVSGSGANFQPGGGTLTNWPSWGDGLVLDGSHWADCGRDLLGGRSQATVLMWFTTPASFPASTYCARFVSNWYTIFGWNTVYRTGNPVLSFACGVSAAGNTIGYGTTVLQPTTDYFGAAVLDGTQATNAGRLQLYLGAVAEAMGYDATVPSSLFAFGTNLGLAKDTGIAPSASYPQGIGGIKNLVILPVPLSPGEIASWAEEPWRDVQRPPQRRWIRGAGRPVITAPAPSGGVIAGGSAAPSATFTPIAPSGGVVVGGSTGVPQITYIAVASGGLVLGGTAPPTARFTTTPAGGVEVGGSAVPGVTFTQTAVGGIVLGGVVLARATSVTFRRTTTTFHVGAREHQ